MKSELSSCRQSKPLVALEGESAQASILNYNLPASTTFRVRNYIKISIPDKYWNAQALKSEENHPHKAVEKPPQNKREETETGPPRTIDDHLKDILGKTPIIRAPRGNPGDPVEDPFEGYLQPALVELAATQPSMRPLLALHQPEQYFQKDIGGIGQGIGISSGGIQFKSQRLEGASMPTLNSLTQAEEFLGTTVAEVNLRAAYGELPAFRRSLYGNLRTEYVGNASGDVRPTLILIEEYEIASYLGDYGAGKTIKTFSLLPGEKSTISIKTFRTATENKSQTENILDSFSQSSADTLETMINSELSTSSSSSDAIGSGFSNTDSSEQKGSLSASAGGLISMFTVKASVSGSFTNSSTDVNTGTSNSTRANTANGLKKSMDQHVAQSESARKVEVNTETQQSVSTTTGEENSTIREIQNINHSRVLNFVFRQLCQEYVTVTYLNDVSFGFTKGYLGDGRTEKLDNLDGLLKSVIKEKYIDEVKTILIDELANVYDYHGTRTSFVERVEESIVSLVKPTLPTRKNVYFRKNSKLAQSWEEAGGKMVSGIILDVSRRILTTDAVIVEALLGQGEALDCYNQRLQEAAADRAELDNRTKAQAIDIIDKIEDATEKANFYKKVFGTDPQTIIKGIEE